MSAQLLYAKELGLIVTDIQGNAIDLNHVKGAIIAHQIFTKTLSIL